jgi:ribonuclease P/MRP protein subunit POP3
MSEHLAKSHTHASNRAKPLEQSDRKVVFKSVLHNPFQIRWSAAICPTSPCTASNAHDRPSVSINVQNVFLAGVISLLDGVNAYHTARDDQHRKRKKRKAQLANEGRPSTRRKTNKDSDLDATVVIENAGSEMTGVPIEAGATDDTRHGDADTMPAVEPPAVLKHLTLGINEVTKRLESLIKATRVAPLVPVLDSQDARPTIKLVFVCRADIDPPLLIAHLPHLVAAYNSSILSSSASRHLNFIKLVPLPKGAEFRLAEALGIRRIAALLLDVSCILCSAQLLLTISNKNYTPGLSSFDAELDLVPTLTAEWLKNRVVGQPKALVPTHIKQVRTSAPKDMKSAKEKRKAGRALAKVRRIKQTVHIMAPAN